MKFGIKISIELLQINFVQLQFC